MAARLSRPPRFRISRSLAGLGMFACEPIKKGRFIARYSGRKIDTDKADELNNKYLFEINARWTIDGASRSNVARYINHSCRPNAEPYFVKHVIKIRAIKNIKPDEEITYNYGRGYFDCFIKAVGCKCIACRKKKAKARAERRKELARKRRAAERKNSL
jgi:SET domain-containing protein